MKLMMRSWKLSHCEDNAIVDLNWKSLAVINRLPYLQSLLKKRILLRMLLEGVVQLSGFVGLRVLGFVVVGMRVRLRVLAEERDRLKVLTEGQDRL